MSEGDDRFAPSGAASDATGQISDRQLSAGRDVEAAIHAYIAPLQIATERGRRSVSSVSRKCARSSGGLVLAEVNLVTLSSVQRAAAPFRRA